MTDYCRVIGQNGSPYSVKMRAIFRYRRIPHLWQQRTPEQQEETAHVRPQLMPMVLFPDGSDWRVDSTPIAYELEERYEGRSILPDDPAARFLSDLIEDFGDEWLTKAMFHYRWFYATDRDYAAWWIASDRLPAATPLVDRRDFAREIGARQVSRMALVGCTEANRPVIEESYRRTLEALESHCGIGAFLFGSRPALGDFGLFGQLKTLSDDPTPRDEMRRLGPTVLHWVRQMDDLSGVEGEWRSPETPTPDAVAALLRICGEAYLPYLKANVEAAEAGKEELSLTIWGRPYAQASFRYQVKCYSRLRSLYARLEGDAKDRADALLGPSGCLEWLA